MDIVYCFDSNYNIQALCSINSLINNSDTEINLHIIHDNPESFKKILNNYSKFKFISSLKVYQFKSDLKFPALENSHVSKATYYRMFISSYISKDIENIVYLDPDVICIKNFSKIVKNLQKELNKSDYVISAISTPVNQEMKDTLLNRLKIDDKYFNAGVMLIDLKKWNKFGIEKKLLKTLNDLENNITYWDQDVLNSYFNGNYMELPNELNYMLAATNTTKKFYKMIREKIIFLHYVGNLKPWTVKGGLFLTSEFYHQSYSELNLDKYHIITKYKLSTFYQLINGIITLKIFNLKQPIKYIYLVLKLILRK